MNRILANQKVFRIFQGNEYLGGRITAFKIRSEIEKEYRENHELFFVLDFEKVLGVSHSFADELLSPLHDLWEKDVDKFVIITNCSPSLKEDLESVANLHSLYIPKFSS